MERGTVHWIMFAVLLAVLVMASTAARIRHCDERSLDKKMQRCSQHQYRFLRKFRWHKAGAPTSASVCGAYRTFRKCVDPALDRCPDFREKFLQSWGHVVSLMDCSCSEKPTGCFNDLQCLLDQSNNVLARRCDVMFQFHKKQRVFNECKLIQESISCKSSLVGSACPRAEDAAYQINKLTFDHVVLTNSVGCSIEKDRNYKGFSYKPSCPVNFIDQMNKCKDKYIDSKERLGFYDENDLIVDGTRQEIDDKCRAHAKYEECMAPIVRHCKLGVQYAYETDTPLRVYLNKLRFICEKKNTDYPKHLSCLQKTVFNKTLEVCNPLWNVVCVHLDRMTSYQFYCQGQYRQATYAAYSRVHRELGELQDCYQGAYEDSCGQAASIVMGDLMQIVRHDPYYLRFKHAPDCSLLDNHKQKPSRQPTIPSQTTKDKSQETVTDQVPNKNKKDNTIQNNDTLPKTEAYTNCGNTRQVVNTVSFSLILVSLFLNT